MALGGVPTGSMYEQLAARAVGTRKSMGFSPRLSASAPAMGRNVAAVAVLLVSSVSSRMPNATMLSTAIVGR